MFVFPIMIIPAFSRRSITSALYCGTKFSSIFDAQVVFLPFIQILSFTAIGTPASGPVYVPSWIPFSTSFARAYASFLYVSRYACTLSSLLSIWSKTSFTPSRTLTSRCLIFAASSRAVIDSSSIIFLLYMNSLSEFLFIIRSSSVPDTVLLLLSVHS